MLKIYVLFDFRSEIFEYLIDKVIRLFGRLTIFQANNLCWEMRQSIECIVQKAMINASWVLINWVVSEDACWNLHKHSVHYHKTRSRLNSGPHGINRRKKSILNVRSARESMQLKGSEKQRRSARDSTVVWTEIKIIPTECKARSSYL